MNDALQEQVTALRRKTSNGHADANPNTGSVAERIARLIMKAKRARDENRIDEVTYARIVAQLRRTAGGVT
jgi:hypothetical protein